MNLNLFDLAMNSPYVFSFADDNTIPDGGTKAKRMIQIFLTKMSTFDEFKKDDGEAKALLLGRRSI